MCFLDCMMCFSIQLRYESNWTAVFGLENGNRQEMELYDKELIIQVSGKHSGYIYELMFVTNLGRSFKVGVSSGNSFNFFPTMKGSQLRFLSGRHNGYAMTSIGAHWALVKWRAILFFVKHYCSIKSYYLFMPVHVI